MSGSTARLLRGGNTRPTARITRDKSLKNKRFYTFHRFSTIAQSAFIFLQDKIAVFGVY